MPLTLATGAGQTVTLNNTIASGAVTSTSATTRSLSVRSLNNLTAAKSFSPSTVSMGETSTIQIVLTNPNSGLSTSVTQLSENLPGNLVATNTTPTVTGAGSCSSVANGAANSTAPASNTVPANSVLNDRRLPQGGFNRP